MSSYTFYGYAAPVYPPQHTAQAYMVVPAHTVVMQPVQMPPVLVHPPPSTLVTETWTLPGELLPRPGRKPRAQRSEREASEAYGYPSSQSKPKDQSRTYDQQRARLGQPLPPKKAIEYRPQKQEDDEHFYHSDDSTAVLKGPQSSRDNNLDKNGKYKKKPTSSQRIRKKGELEEQKKPTSSQRVRTKGEPEEQKKPTSSQRVRTKGEPEEQKKPTSSQRVRTKGEPEEQTRIHKWVESLPQGLDEEAKESSENSAGTEWKHKTKEPTSSQRAHTKGDPSDPRDHGYTQKFIDSQPDVGDKQAKGGLVDSAGDERKHTTKNRISVPHPETDSKRRPEKPAEQAKERRSTKTTDTGRAHTTAHSSSNRPSILRGESQSGPKRGESGTSTPAKKSTGHQSKKNATGSSRASQSKKITKEEVQTDSVERGASEPPWHIVYRKGEDGQTVRR